MSRIRANKITNKIGTGAVELEKGAHLPIGMGITGAGGVNITGVVTATSFSGNGAALTGIDATAIKDSGGNVKIQAQASGAVYTGIHTFTTAHATTFVGALTGNPTGTIQTAAQPNITSLGTLSSLNVSGNVSIGGTLTYEDVVNVDSVGVVTARAGLKVTGGTSFFAGAIAAAGAITGTASTALSFTVADESSDTTCFPIFSTAATGTIGPKTGSNLSFNSSTGQLNATKFVGDGSSLTGISVGIATNAQTVTNGNTLLLDLSKDDHKVTATGTVTISCTGGTEGDSHTVRIVNSGIATVGFSTYFKFPSGATPTIPITSGAISLITFTVHQAGSTGISTQLLSGASVNFS